MATATKKTTTKKTTEKSAADKGPYTYSCGKRKTAVARVKIFAKGKGDFEVNGLKLKKYFTVGKDIESILAPFKTTNVSEKDYDIEVAVSGSGIHAQAEAVRHGIARALVKEIEERRAMVKPAGFLTRDGRSKERQKPGFKRARRSPQWSKR